MGKRCTAEPEDGCAERERERERERPKKFLGCDVIRVCDVMCDVISV